MFFKESDFFDARYDHFGIGPEFLFGNFPAIFDFRQDVLDTVEPRSFLVVRSDNGPWRKGSVGFIEHLKFSNGVVVPFFLSHSIDG